MYVSVDVDVDVDVDAYMRLMGMGESGSRLCADSREGKRENKCCCYGR